MHTELHVSGRFMPVPMVHLEPLPFIIPATGGDDSPAPGPERLVATTLALISTMASSSEVR